MKFKSIQQKANMLDNLIDDYIKQGGTRFVPGDALDIMVISIFPYAKPLGVGLHKHAYRLQHKSHQLVLKVGTTHDIELDHRTYKHLPHEVRHVYLAKIYWHTKYSLLQPFGVEAEMTQQELAHIRAVAGKYNLLDITCENIRIIDGDHKIVDAGVAPPGLYKLWKAADVITMRLPPIIKKIIRKSRLLVATAGR